LTWSVSTWSGSVNVRVKLRSRGGPCRSRPGCRRMRPVRNRRISTAKHSAVTGEEPPCVLDPVCALEHGLAEITERPENASQESEADARTRSQVSRQHRPDEQQDEDARGQPCDATLPGLARAHLGPEQPAAAAAENRAALARASIITIDATSGSMNRATMRRLLTSPVRADLSTAPRRARLRVHAGSAPCDDSSGLRLAGRRESPCRNAWTVTTGQSA
jgi:hypothetical protein